MGQLCAYNKSTVEYKGDYKWDYDGMTYSDEQRMMFILAVVQAIFWTV